MIIKIIITFFMTIFIMMIAGPANIITPVTWFLPHTVTSPPT